MADQQNRAVATRHPDDVDMSTSAIMDIRSVAGRDDVERYETTVVLPAAYQYVIPGKKKIDNQWVEDNKVGITADGYDYLNRVLGVSFFKPATVVDDTGKIVPNPIHRKDYIYLSLGAVWYNEAGQLVTHQEDLEVDFMFMYQQARLESYGSELVMRNGEPAINPETGFPILKLKDADAEKKALKTLLQLRSMGMRYAQTVLRTRLLKVALGIKSLPLQQPRNFTMRVTGFRDALDPKQREAKVTEGVAAMLGAPAAKTAPALSFDELAAIEGIDADADIDMTMLEATGLKNVSPPDDESGDDAPDDDPYPTFR